MSSVPPVQTSGPYAVPQDFRAKYTHFRRARIILYAIAIPLCFASMATAIVGSSHRLESYDIGSVEGNLKFLAAMTGVQGGAYLIFLILTALPCKPGTKAPWYRSTILDITFAAAIMVPYIMALALTTVWAQYYQGGGYSRSYSQYGGWEVFGVAAVGIAYITFAIGLVLLILMSVAVAQVPADQDTKWNRRFGDWFDLVQPWQVNPQARPQPLAASRTASNDTAVARPSMNPKKFEA